MCSWGFGLSVCVKNVTSGPGLSSILLIEATLRFCAGFVFVGDFGSKLRPADWTQRGEFGRFTVARGARREADAGKVEIRHGGQC